MKTFMPSATTVERKWYVVDATDMTLQTLQTYLEVRTSLFTHQTSTQVIS